MYIRLAENLEEFIAKLEDIEFKSDVYFKKSLLNFPIILYIDKVCII